ncbi:glycosyltransferase family 2 protein [Halovulum dunhuangense]|uniref:Glycosyltransferase family 2 protein n=1 Tax=Halovulum dunhuangense TaxID=1505036 RepID=A0A849L6D7_9RHOB|nr:glycosyltransferase family 2 protein [Halovulum dunhuangense]NNU81989.1 glycosyltransferase family 2 protein [Halovulum dunhuangense]
MNNPRVLVLLSTWNGEKFLEEQLDSIFSQDFGGTISILARDDGSSDATVEILRSYGPERIRVVVGENLGPARSFLTLLEWAKDIEAEYYALSDQDDVWKPQKIARAIECLQRSGSGFYCSALDLVDEELRPLSRYRHAGDQSLASTLIGNYATGCTCVMDREFLEHLRFPVRSSQILMHDWWLSLTASANGSVRYDNESHILYRQHGANHVGLRSSVAGVLERGLKALRRSRSSSCLSQAQEFKAAYGADLPADASRMLAEFLNASRTLPGRLWFVLGNRKSVGALSAIR